MKISDLNLLIGFIYCASAKDLKKIAAAVKSRYKELKLRRG